MRVKENYIFLHVRATKGNERGRRIYHIHGRFDKKLQNAIDRKSFSGILEIKTATWDAYSISVQPTKSANLANLDESIRKLIIGAINRLAVSEQVKWSEDSPLHTEDSLRLLHDNSP